MLQWSRGVAAAEALELMETKPAEAVLQWSRGVAAAEAMLGPSDTFFRLARLQWSRGVADAEASARARAFRGALLASMEPRRRRRGSRPPSHGPIP